jgi:hypothetical protein
VKNSLAILVRVLEQARRDGIVELNQARVTGWQGLGWLGMQRTALLASIAPDDVISYRIPVRVR